VLTFDAPRFMSLRACVHFGSTEVHDEHTHTHTHTHTHIRYSCPAVSLAIVWLAALMCVQSR
jgi:hypothetical protein